MKLSTPRFTLGLLFQLLFILIDLIFNCASLFPRSRDGLLVLFILQDLFLILAITTMLMSFFSTYLFQAGLVEVLVRKYRGCVCVSCAYVCVSVASHAVWLVVHWHSTDHISSPLLISLFTLHRCTAPWFYFVYKRAALTVSDPRLYDDVDWISRTLTSH